MIGAILGFLALAVILIIFYAIGIPILIIDKIRGVSHDVDTTKDED